MKSVPSYFDGLIAAYRRGEMARPVHLGYWSNSDDDGDFPGAQARLDQVMIDLAGIRNGQSVLDVGCGFGGTLARINEAYQNMRLAGINIDARQIDICRTVAPRVDNVITWHIADAAHLPFAGGCFDRVFCVEAMFHFPSRRQFFAEASRVLAPGGILVGTDILISLPGRSAAFSPIETVLQAGFGPWPDVWGTDADHVDLATAAGLNAVAPVSDITREVAPSHRYTTLPEIDPRDARVPKGARAAAGLRFLSDRGWLRYVSFRFERPR